MESHWDVQELVLVAKTVMQKQWLIGFQKNQIHHSMAW